MNDLYTKTVLTIIAASLLALVAQNAIRSSQAQLSGALQKVQICGDTGECAQVRKHFPSAAYGLVILPP